MIKRSGVIAAIVVLAGVGYHLSAEEVVSACDPFAPDSEMSCVEESAITLAARGAVSDAFALLRDARVARKDTSDCYLVAHHIGIAAAKAIGPGSLSVLESDPSLGMCSGGYFYGAASVLDAARLEPAAIRAVCAQGTPAQRAGCAKSIGSRFHHLTNADIARAFDYCDAGSAVGDVTPVSAPEWQKSCYEGVMHDALMPLHPSVAADPRLHGVTRDSAQQFCDAFGDEVRRDACILGAWPFFDEDLRDADSIRRYCTALAPERQLACRSKLYRTLGWRLPDDVPGIAQICDGAASEASRCINEASKELLRNRGMQGAVALCDNITAGERSICRKTVAENSLFFTAHGTGARVAMCASIDVDLQDTCLSVSDGIADRKTD